MLDTLLTVGTSVLGSALGFVLETGSDLAKEWVKQYFLAKQNKEEVPEVPAEIEAEVDKLVKQYLEEQKSPIYMNGVIYFLQEEPDDEIRQELRDMIHQIEWNSDDCSEYECTVYAFTEKYMGEEREETNFDFGFEKNTLYLNFIDTGFSTLYDGTELREMADALNKFLPDDNQIEGFVTF